MADSPSASVSAEEAAALFADLATQTDIAFRFLQDSCYARAHLMAQRLVELGVVPRKVWTFAQSGLDLLWVKMPGRPGERVTWRYHVAPILRVRGADGVVQDVALDPSLFDRPATIEEWREAQHDTPETKVTALGEPPRPALGGSGYWPGPNPLEGPDVHARETMDEYKAFQGTTDL